MATKQETAGKLPPQNVEAEQSLIGSVLISSPAFNEIAPLVMAQDFYDQRHRRIFEAMKELSEKGDAIDMLTITESLRVKGQLESAGGASYVSTLADSVPTAAHATDYAMIVREKAILRRLIEISTSIISTSFSEEKPPAEILQEAEHEIFNITEREQRTGMKEVKDMIGDVYEHMKKMGESSDALTGLPTGFARIDEYTSGLQKKELVIVAARPSLGKTSLAMNMAYDLAVRKKKNILVFSFEMSEEDLIKRLIAIGSRVSMQKIRRGKFMTREENARVVNVCGQLSQSFVWIDTEDNDVFNMRAKGRSLSAQLRKAGKTLDLLVIDYMQLVKPSDGKVAREQQIAQISRSLKAMARELDIPVIAISQLNREVEKRDRTTRGGDGGKIPPKLSDLRESGAIEQDADVVLFIDREAPDPKNPDAEQGDLGDGVFRKIKKCKLIIAKNRNGPTGDQNVIFVPELTAFVESSERDTDEAVDYGPQEQF